ncbi:Ribosome maturation factor RimP [Syntrophomonas zehnderi OL-4]|uniref:Ribosome maturation factor RimP n=1 Tax=Syntrophomonas zehnderi OL-4 TaxID=690567 RepID=A0A0E4GBF1_9FIRM|nr:ribosome maturation factor RimP [Syntrophomonas zehnderi]CFX67434.1 Ribosome maturation factor RimP [Syntrophomonas zehnderi OL-4]
MAKSIARRIEYLISDILQEKGIELLEVEYKKEHGDQMLRIYIDRDEGVDLNTCTIATRAVQDIIDQDNIDYDHLEVSSPGIDRLLKRDKDFIKHQGERIRIKTLKPLDGQKTFVGILLDTSNDVLKIEIDGNSRSIPRNIISQIRLHPEI